MASRADDVPLRRAIVLAVAAVILYLLLKGNIADFVDVPLMVGLSYLAAAVAGGRGGSLWAPGLVVTGWGLGEEALARDWFPSLQTPESAAHMVGIGVGVIALGLLARLRVQVSLLSVGIAIVLSGLIFIGQRGKGYASLNEASGYAALLLAFAGIELTTHVARRLR